MIPPCLKLNIISVVGALPISSLWTLLTLICTERFRCQRGRSISVLSEQYETSYLFYVSLYFLYNIICYLISVFAFSLVTLSGATTYWRWRTRTKKETLQQAKGLIAQHSGEDTLQQQRDTQLQVIKESTTKIQHTTNRRIFLLNNYKVSNCTNDGVCWIADI